MLHVKDVAVDFFLSHKRGLIISVVIAVSAWFVFKGLMQIPTIEKNRNEIAEVETRLEEEKDRQAEIDDLSTKVNTDEYIERIASEKLGLVKSNATIFYDISDED